MAEPPTRLLPILECPVCREALAPAAEGSLACTNATCRKHEHPFGTCRSQPVLVDFENSIFNEADYAAGDGSVQERDPEDTNLRVKIGAFIMSSPNHAALRMAEDMQARLARRQDKSRLLIIGGGVKGGGTAPLYGAPNIDVVAIDVYASPLTQLIADAHSLPFANECFDAVWIQAVLEHVLEPHAVAAEIHRVLKPDGLLYADTPFMQQVHEAAYDFTRFTLSGHRWLFRNFDEIEAGVSQGAGTAAIWSLRYLWRALGLPFPVATLMTLPVFWLRFFDRFAKKGPNGDAASGVYFYGRKSTTSLKPRDMVAYYAGLQG